MAEKDKAPVRAGFSSTVILSSVLGISLLRKINPSGEEKSGERRREICQRHQNFTTIFQALEILH